MAQKKPPTTKKTPVSKPVSKDEPAHEKTLAQKSNKKVLAVITIVVVLVLFGLLLWQYLKTKNELKRINDPNAAVQKESQDLVKQIQQNAVLPTNETPVPFEIKDVTKFESNPVFAQAQNGDKGLIYQEAGWIVIYRPSTKQVIAASPVALNEGEAVQTQQ